MPDDLIRKVAARGGLAAEEIINKFLTQAPDGWDGWSAQRWVRLDVHLNALGQKSGGMRRALSPTFVQGNSYEDLVKLARMQCAPGHARALTDEEAQALTNLIQSLQSLAALIDTEATKYTNLPVPPAELRAGPPL